MMRRGFNAMQNGVFDERLKQKALKPQIEQALILHIDLILNVPLVANVLNIDILLQQSQLLPQCDLLLCLAQA